MTRRWVLAAMATLLCFAAWRCTSSTAPSPPGGDVLAAADHSDRPEPSLVDDVGDDGDEALTGGPTRAWSWAVPAGFSAGDPLVAGDLVVASAGLHEVVALSAQTGRPRWTADLGSEWWSRFVRPTMGAGLIVAVVEREAGGDGLAGIDPDSGRLVWTVDLELDGAVGAAIDAPAGVVVTADRGGRIVGVGTADGSPSWEQRATGPVEGLAARPGGFVVAVGGPEPALVALDAQGSAEWWVELPVGPVSAPALVAGSWGVDVAVVDGAGDLRSFDATTGADRWSQAVGSAGNPAVKPSVASDGRHVVAAGQVGHRLVVDAADGRPVWRGPALWAPWLAGPVAVVGSSGAVTVVLPIDSGSAIVGGVDRPDALLDTAARLSGVSLGVGGTGVVLVAGERGEDVNHIVAWNVGGLR